MKEVGADWGENPSRPHFQIRDVDKTRLSDSVAKSESRRGLQEGDTTNLLCI